MSFPVDEQNRVRRNPGRGHYDRDTIYAILDDGYLCHAGFVVNGQPFVIPTLYGRIDDAVYLHGSAASRMMRQLSDGVPVCLTVTHVDGLVLARSAYHHSMNYRSAILFGTATLVEGEEQDRGLQAISDQILPGRWEECRLPNEKELKATSVLRLSLDTASAKIRTGPPHDEAEDYDLPVWAGVLSLQSVWGPVEADPQLREGIDVPDSVKRVLA